MLPGLPRDVPNLTFCVRCGLDASICHAAIGVCFPRFPAISWLCLQVAPRPPQPPAPPPQQPSRQVGG